MPSKGGGATRLNKTVRAETRLGFEPKGTNVVLLAFAPKKAAQATTNQEI